MISYPDGNPFFAFACMLALGCVTLLSLFIGPIVGREVWKAGEKLKATMCSAGPVLVCLSIVCLIEYSDSRDQANKDAQNKAFAELSPDIGKAFAVAGGAADSHLTLRDSRVLIEFSLGANHKALVVRKAEAGKPELDPIQFLLPGRLRPRMAEDVAVIVVIDCSLRRAGMYEDGAEADATDCQMSIVSRATEAIPGAETLSAEAPIAKVVHESHDELPAVGSIPAQRIVDYIAGVL